MVRTIRTKLLFISAIAVIAFVAVGIAGCGGNGGGGETDTEGAEGAPGAPGAGGKMGPGAPGMGGPGSGMGGGMGGGGGGGGSAPPTEVIEKKDAVKPPSAPKIQPAKPPTEGQRKTIDRAVDIERQILAGHTPEPVEAESEGAQQASRSKQDASESSEEPEPLGTNPEASGDMNFMQSGAPPGAPPSPAGGPAAGKAGGPPKAPGQKKGPAMGAGGPSAQGAAGAPQTTAGNVPPAILAMTIHDICSKIRGIKMTDQKWFHEYWYFAARATLYDVLKEHKDFPIVELVHAAQVKTDWEGYFWHWAIRKLLEQKDFEALKKTAEQIAQARIALGSIRAISEFGLLMHDVDRTKLGYVINPTTEHVLNCIEFATGNPNLDPATIERDASKRSKLIVEIFDNYIKRGHNWQWHRSRNWSYLCRVSNNLPATRCDSCGKKLTRDDEMWRCPRCGKSPRAPVPGTYEAVEPHECAECGYRDQYRTYGLQCTASQTGPDGRYVLKRSWNSPTFTRIRDGLANAQFTHHLASIVFAENDLLVTEADREAYEAWLAASPCPTRKPRLHRMELEAHRVRLNNAIDSSDAG